jgi:hypothetical protein
VNIYKWGDVSESGSARALQTTHSEGARHCRDLVASVLSRRGAGESAATTKMAAE